MKAGGGISGKLKSMLGTAPMGMMRLCGAARNAA
jgi:hypothetical protein